MYPCGAEYTGLWADIGCTGYAECTGYAGGKHAGGEHAGDGHAGGGHAIHPCGIGLFSCRRSSFLSNLRNLRHMPLLMP